MKKITAIILAITLAITMAVSLSAVNIPVSFTEEHTVVWSEVSDGKVTLITTAEYDELSTADQISPAFTIELDPTSSITQLLSDGSKKGEELLNLAIGGKKIPEGTVITVEYDTFDASYPAKIGKPRKVTFTEKRTSILTSQVKPILDTLDLEADGSYGWENFDTITDFTVVGSVYNEKTGKCDLAISMREKHFSVAENKDLWYYTTTNISMDISAEEDGGISVSNDGTKKGKQEFDNLFNRNGYVTYGTVVELRWNGMIQESYPPQLCGIREVRFTGKQTDYTDEDMYQERAAMNRMFNEACHYPEQVNPISDGKAVSNDKADKNPATGRDNVFAGIALMGMLAWAACVVSARGRAEEGELS